MSNALKYATNLQLMVQQVLKVHDITIAQFQILSVLVKSHPLKLAVKDVKKQLPRRTSDFTRMVDRLETKSLVERFECPVDRRRSELFLTGKGLKLMSQLNKELEMIAGEFKEITTINGDSITEIESNKRTA